MKYGFNIFKINVEGHVFWVAESKDLKGCVGQGDTIEEAIKELNLNEEEWLDTAKEYGIAIPEPSVEKMPEYSGKFMTRVSPAVHREAAENAMREGISLNQYVNNAIVTMNACGTTREVVTEMLGNFKEIIGMASKPKSASKDMLYNLSRNKESLRLVVN